MKSALYLLALCCLVMLCLAADACAGAPLAEESPYLIKLKNRQFIPDPGVDPALREKLETDRIKKAHGMAQLFKAPTPSDRKALSDAGILLKRYMMGTTYHAEFSEGTRWNDVAGILRWAGPLLPEDKMEKDLLDGNIQDWAKTEKERIRVLVSFHEGVDRQAAERVLARYADGFNIYGPSNTWATEISGERIKDLAAEEIVRWIQQGPIPFMPLPD